MAGKSSRSLKKKSHIIECVISLIDEDGLKNISIQDICHCAGISVGAFYHYFSSKNALIDEIYQEMDRTIVDHTPEIAGHQDERENLRQLATRIANVSFGYGPNVNRMIMLDTFRRSYTQYRQMRRKLWEMGHSMLMRGQAKGQITSDLPADALCDMFFVLLRGYDFEWIKQSSGYDLRGRVAAHMSLFLSSIAA